jgi:hypothetical protein
MRGLHPHDELAEGREPLTPLRCAKRPSPAKDEGATASNTRSNFSYGYDLNFFMIAFDLGHEHFLTKADARIDSALRD